MGDPIGHMMRKMALEGYHQKDEIHGGNDNPVILLLGGIDPSHPKPFAISPFVLQYSPFENSWDLFTQFDFARCYHGSALLNGMIYIVGGYKTSGLEVYSKEYLRASNDVFEFDVSHAHCYSKAPMNVARACLGLCAVGGKLYAVGGRDQKGRLLDSIECYDPDRDQWTLLDVVLPHPVMGPAVTDFLGYLWIIGGLTYTAEEAPNDVALIRDVIYYNPDENRISKSGSLPSGLAFSSAVVVDGGRGLWLLGGCNGFTQPTHLTSNSHDILSRGSCLKSSDHVLVLDVDVFEWRTAAFKLSGKRHASACAVLGPCVYMMGGMDHRNRLYPLNSLELIVYPGPPEEHPPKALAIGLTGCTSVVLPGAQRLDDAEISKSVRTALWATNAQRARTSD